MRALIVTIVLSLAATQSLQAADPVNGKRVYARCAACHLADDSGRSTLGPNLHGVVGRTAGALPKFRYSPAMAKSGIVWKADKLDAFLAKPRDVVSNTNMPFAGLPLASDRADVIAYLETLK